MKTKKSWLLIVALLAVVVAMVACTPKPTKYAVTVDETITNGVVTVDTAEATAGTVITVTVEPAAGYKLKDNTLKANFDVIAMTEGAYTFTMPAEDVEITAQFERIKYTVTATADSDKGTVSVSKVRALPGETITVTPAAKTGWEISAVKVNGSEIEAVQGFYTFTMPEGNVEVVVEFAETRYGFTIEPQDNVTVTADVTDTSLTAGTVVTLSHTDLDEKFVFVNYLVNGEPIAGDSFTMGSEAVTVTAQLRQVRGESFGNANNAAGSYWTYETDTGASPSISLVNGDQGNMIWNLTTAQNVYFETKVNVASLTNDGNPTAGIIIKEALESNKRGYFFHIKVKDLANGNEVRLMPANDLMGYNYQWSGAKLTTAADYSGDGKFATLAVARLDRLLYCFYNGALVYVGSQTDLGETVQVGFKAMGVASITYSDYTLLTDADAISTKLGTAKITAAAAPAWTAGLTSVGVQGTGNYEGKGVTFYAKAVEGGVKVAAVAKHSIYTIGFAGSDWWKNTNFEMRSGTRHLFLTANAWANDDLFANAFYTVFDGTYYNTVAEGFIPDAMLTKTDGIARLGFAWKTPGGKTNNGADLDGNEADWWMPKGSWCGEDVNKQFYVHASGVSIWKNDTLYTVTAQSDENVTVAVDKAQAHEGESVTVTVSVLNDLYELEKITVNGADADATFAMPAQNVTVAAVLTEKNNGLFSPVDKQGTWDLTEDKKGNAEVVATATDHQYLFTKARYQSFWFETKLNISAVSPTDGNPTTGISIEHGGKGTYFYIKAAGMKEGNEARIMRTREAKFDGQWPGVYVGNVGKYTGDGEAATLAVAKLGDEIYYFLDGALVFVESYPEFSGDCKLGLVSMGVFEYKYFDYSILSETAAIEEKLGAAKVTAVAAPEWTEGLTSARFEGTGEYASKNATFYAKKVDGGIKIAAVATHAVYRTENTAWHTNTNLEMWSGGKHYWFSASPDSSEGNDRVQGISFLTRFDEDAKLYTTVAECFIADAHLETRNGVPRIGFAWKTPDDLANNGADLDGNPSVWWHVKGRWGNNADQQYYVLESGLFDYPSATAHEIGITPSDKATIKLSKNKAYWTELVTVTVEVTDDAYDLSKILVNGVESEATFVMPNESVTVSVELAEKDNGMFGTSQASATAPTAGWDLTEDKKGNKELRVTAGGNEYIFLKEVATDFYFETKLNVTSVKPDDPNPTTGIVIKKGALGEYFYVRALNLGLNEVRIMRGNDVTNFQYQWIGQELARATAYTGESSITLAVAKLGLNSYFFVNGSCVGVFAYTELDGEVQIGLTSMNVTEFKYFDYSLIKTTPEVEAKLGAAKFTAAAPAWTEGLESVGVNGYGMVKDKNITFYAQKVEGGARVAVVANHAAYVANNGSWWLNTNMEFISGQRDTDPWTQIWANSRLEANAMNVTKFATTFDAAKKIYTTVVEGFIAADAFKNVGANGEYRAGVAWKTAGDEINNGHSNGGQLADYWVPVGHEPGTKDAQLYITETGISAYAGPLYEVVATTTEDVAVTVSRAKAHAGEPVSVLVDVINTNKVLTKIILTKETVVGDEAKTVIVTDGRFTMPATNVEITVELRDKTDADNGIFGYSGESSVAMSGQYTEANGALTATGATGYHYAFLKETSADFYFEAKLNITAVDGGDNNPTTGIIVKNGNNGVYFFVRALGLATNDVRIMEANNVLACDWAWSGIEVGRATAYTGESFLTLAVAKLDHNTYFFLNGTLVYTVAYTSELGVDSALQIGVGSMNVTEYKYYDFVVETEESAVEAKLGANKVTGAAPAWTEGLASASVVGSDKYAGKGVTFYAQVVEGGVKVAAVAKHWRYYTPEGDWWKNTNFEMFGMHGGSRVQYWAIPQLRAGNMTVTQFATVFDEDTGFYTTVVEGFVSNVTVTDGVARMAFAWKTDHDMCNNGHDGTSAYWLVPGRPTGENEMFYVTANGLLESAPAA